MPHTPRPRPTVAGITRVVVAALVVASCSALTATPPAPTPADFPGLAGIMARHGIDIADYVSGDAGCVDPTLAPTAIRFAATGLDASDPIVARIYIFRNRETYERRRADVDACALSWAGDPARIEAVDASPFVVVGAGPWPADFKRALRAGLIEAAGNGG